MLVVVNVVLKSDLSLIVGLSENSFSAKVGDLNSISQLLLDVTLLIVNVLPESTPLHVFLVNYVIPVLLVTVKLTLPLYPVL